jgi:hypothetical protein
MLTSDFILIYVFSDLIPRLKKKVFRIVKMIPQVKKRIKDEKSKMSHDIEESFHKQVEGYLTALPDKGYSMVHNV